MKIKQSLLITCNLAFTNTSLKILVIYIDSKLTWEQHIDYVRTKLSRVLFLLRNLKSVISENYLRVTYFAYFQSILNYGILLWGNSHIYKVFLLQRKTKNFDKFWKCGTL